MAAALCCITYNVAATGCAHGYWPHRSGGSAQQISFNLSEDPHSLNPILAQSDDERQIAHLMFDMLLDVDPHGRLIPALATQVPSVENGGVSADGRTIMYHLRHDVRWQDGQQLTASDVIFTWRAIVDPANPVQSTRGYNLIDLIFAPDPYTVVVRLKRPWAPAVATLFTYGTNPMPILPAHLLQDEPDLQHGSFGLHPIGSGPYRLEHWDHANRLIFRANDGYYKGRPKTPTLIAEVLPDVNTTLTMLSAGQLDWSLQSPAQRLALRSDSNLRFIYAPFSGFGAVVFNCRAAPFDDVRVRRAVAMAIDRKRLSDAITSGQYPVANSDQPVFSWAHDPTARLVAYDPQGSDRLLDALGWLRGPDGLRRREGKTLELSFLTFPEGDTAVRTAEYVQQMLRQRGLDVRVKKVSLAQFYLPASEGGLLLSGRFDMAYMAWRSGADPDDSDLVTCRGEQNYAGYCNGAVDSLEQQAISAQDRKQRRRIYGAIQHILASDIPYEYLYAPTYSFAVKRGLRGFSPTPYSPTWNAYDWRASRR